MDKMLANWIFKHLSGNPAEYCTPPGSEVRLEFGEKKDGDYPYVATTYNNDGHDLWIGYNHDKWITFFKARDARQLAWFILWDWWVISTWCGLKRKIWYWALSAKNRHDGIGVRRAN